MNKGQTACAVFALVWACAAAFGQGLVVHAMTGQSVAGGHPWEVYRGFIMSSPPRIEGGNIVFRAYTNGSPDYRQSPLIVGQVGSPVLGFRFTGESGIPGVQFASIDFDLTSDTIRTSASGAFGVVARLQGEGVTIHNDEVLIVGNNDGFRIIAREGSQAPGDTPGAIMRAAGQESTWHRALSGWSLSSTGRVAFSTPITHPQFPGFASHTGVLTNATGELHLVARGNHGTAGNGTIVEGWSVHMMDGHPRISPGGTVVAAAMFDLYARVASGGLVMQRDAVLQRLVCLQEAPGIPDVRINRLWYNGRSSPGLNDRGEVSIGVRLLNPSGQMIGSAAVRASPDWLHIVAKTGDPKPGRPGETFSLNDLEEARVLISGSGTVAFADQSKRGVFVGTSIDDLRLAFDPASAIWPSGLGVPLVNPSSIGMNASDQLVAAFTFEGSSTRAIAGWDPVLGNILIAHTGQTMEIEPGVYRTIAELSINGFHLDPWYQPVLSGGGEDGLPNSLDSTGRVVFAVRFTNNQSAVLVATIPAPGTAALCTIILCAFRRRR
jgi:hypothetical protein